MIREGDFVIRTAHTPDRRVNRDHPVIRSSRGRGNVAVTLTHRSSAARSRVRALTHFRTPGSRPTARIRHRTTAAISSGHLGNIRACSPSQSSGAPVPAPGPRERSPGSAPRLPTSGGMPLTSASAGGDAAERIPHDRGHEQDPRQREVVGWPRQRARRHDVRVPAKVEARDGVEHPRARRRLHDRAAEYRAGPIPACLPAGRTLRRLDGTGIDERDVFAASPPARAPRPSRSANRFPCCAGRSNRGRDGSDTRLS